MAADEEILITLKVDTTESAKSLKQLRQEYKDQLKELEGLTVGTKEYVDALSRIGGIKDDIGDLNQTIKAFNPEGKVQAFGNVIGGLASGIQGAVGAMALFGIESEETQKMLLKVQAASAFAEGVKGVVGMGDAFNNLKLVSVQALNAIKVGIGATGIGLLVLALGAVVAYWDDIKSALSGVSSEQEKLLENEKASVKASQDKLSFIDSQSNILKQQGKTEKEILKLKEAESNIAISGLEAQILTQESVKKSQVETAERNKSILQNIIRLVSAPLTLLLSGIDAAGKAFGQDWGLEEKFSGGIAKMLFDPEDVASEGDKAIAETKATLNKLKNDRAGFQLAIKAIDTKANEDAKTALDKELQESKARAAEARKDLEEIHNVKNGFAQLEEQDRLEKEAKADADAEAETQNILSRLASRKELIEFNNAQTFAGQLENLQIQMDAELALVEGNEAAKQLIKEEYAEKNRQLSLQQAAGALEIAQKSNESMQGLADLYFAIKMANVKKGSAEEEKAARQQFKVNKALALTGAILSTAMAAIKSLSQAPLAIGPIPSPIGIASLAATILTGAASVAKIAATQYTSTSSGGGGGGSVNMPSTVEPPAINAPSSSSTSLNADGSVKPTNGQITSRVIVVESDITNKQRQVASMQQNASV